jgi:two-component system aerobic respiration control protein ArcA
MSKSADSKNLLSKIESLARERMTSGKLVSFDDLKSLRKKQSPRILIVEDDEIVLKSLRRILESEDYRVVTAEDARELALVVEEFFFDLIMLDVGLPWVNGFELAEMMKEHPEIRKIPLVFISGHSDVETIKKGFAVGADDYITKPFDLAKIKKTIYTLLELNS